MGQRVFSVANMIFGAVFLIGALLQYNDPDPLGWGALYVAAAAACVVSGRLRHGWWLAAGVGIVSLVWAATLSPIVHEMRLNELAQSMKAETPRIELSREFLGLAIILAWMIVLVWVSRRSTEAR